MRSSCGAAGWKLSQVLVASRKHISARKRVRRSAADNNSMSRGTESRAKRARSAAKVFRFSFGEFIACISDAFEFGDGAIRLPVARVERGLRLDQHNVDFFDGHRHVLDASGDDGELAFPEPEIAVS